MMMLWWSYPDSIVIVAKTLGQAVVLGLVTFIKDSLAVLMIDLAPLRSMLRIVALWLFT
jgi:hypothetical protein